MFYARNDELKALNDFIKTPNQAAIITGKRRVGKTTLIKEALKNDDHIYYECLKDTVTENINNIIPIIQKKGITIPSFVEFKSFISLFEFLNSLNRKMTIVLDEYPYLRVLNNPEIIDSQFQNIIDNHLSNINLIITGSSIKVMNEILNESNPLHARFKLILNLTELNYIDASSFYSNKSIYDKIAFFSVFGGSPYINEYIDPNKSLKENIINLFLDENNGVYSYADKVLISDATNEIQAKRILSALANTKKKYSELEQLLDKEKTGKLIQSLKSLLELGIIKKVFPINKPTDIRKSYYEINDNVLRFFFTYVYKNKSVIFMIGKEAFYNSYIEPSLKTFISHRFEEIIRTYYSILSHKGVLNNILDIGTFYYDDVENKTNGEFDVALKNTDYTYTITEAKYYEENNILTCKEMDKEIEQIKRIKELPIKDVYFVSTSGYEDINNYNCIDINSLYKQ